MNFYQSVLLIGLVQGLMLYGGLTVKNFGKPERNVSFSILILLVSLALLSKLLYSESRQEQFPQVWLIADGVAYLFGPLWYFTLKRSTSQEKLIEKWDSILLFPFLIYVGFLFYIFLMGKEEFMQWSLQPSFDQSFYIFIGTVILVNLSYVFRSQRLIRGFESSFFPPLLRWGQYVFFVVFITWLICLILSLVAFPDLNLQAYNAAFLLMAFLSFGLAFLAILKPAMFYFLTQTFNAEEVERLIKLGERVNEYLKEKKSYLSNDFSLKKLSEELGANSVLTSKAINTTLKTTFNDLINDFRLRHFLELAQSDSKTNLTHWALAQESGFGNKVSFHKAFKKSFGTTPREYLTDLNK